MLLRLDRDSQGKVVSTHLTEFGSALASRRWRRHARRGLPGVPGLVFAKAMPFIGSRRSAGFGGGIPAIGRQVLVAAWRHEDDFELFRRDHFLAEALSAGRSWWVLSEVASTRGSHYGARPLAAADAEDGLLVALTLGRTRLASLPRFLLEGARLGPHVREAPGLITALSAGIPLTGNCTVSIWDSERQMQAFAYADADGHGSTVRRRPPILREQLNARMRLRRLGGDWADALHGDRVTRLAKAQGRAWSTSPA